MVALSVTARLYIPAALNRSLAEYGGLGPVFTLLSWLIVVCAVITGCITVGAVIAQEPPLSHHLGTPAPDSAPVAPGEAAQPGPFSGI
jgi:membrane protein